MNTIQIATESIQKTADPNERHRRKCSVCRHPDREEIEQEYLRWCEPWALARAYGIEDYRLIPRHAAVMGLTERRRANMRPALDAIIEQTPEHVTADAIIRAIRAQACLTDDGRWIEPATQVVFAKSKSMPPADNIAAQRLLAEISQPALPAVAGLPPVEAFPAVTEFSDAPEQLEVQQPSAAIPEGIAILEDAQGVPQLDF